MNVGVDFEHVRCSIQVYPEQPFEALARALPVRQWTCYVLCDWSGTPLYIGHTCDPARRIAEHAETKSWWPAVREILLLVVANEVTARYMERQLHVDAAPIYGQITRADVGRLRALQAPEPEQAI